MLVLARFRPGDRRDQAPQIHWSPKFSISGRARTEIFIDVGAKQAFVNLTAAP